jgi:hypothetical protein
MLGSAVVAMVLAAMIYNFGLGFVYHDSKKVDFNYYQQLLNGLLNWVKLKLIFTKMNEKIVCPLSI